MRKITYFLAGVFILTTSFYMKKTTATTPVSLYNTKWALLKIQTDSGLTDVETRAFLKLDEQKHSAGGNGSCNIFGGHFSVDKDNIRFSQLLSTKMYCPDVQAIENLFLHLLSKVNRFEIKGHTLKLFEDLALALVFEAK